MGSRIVLGMCQQHPFRIGLNKLRGILNDHAELDELAGRGLQRIVVVADHLAEGTYQNLFGTPAFQQWADGSEGWDHNRSFYNWFEKFESDGQPGRAREALLVLRDALNDQKKYEALVRIGPCAITFGWNDLETYDDRWPIDICAYIPDCHPKYDYQMNSDGEIHFHS